MKVWVLTSLLAFVCNPVFAETDQETIAALKAELAALSKRLERLEQSSTIQQRDYVAPQIVRQQTSSGAERIKLEGDFRYRHDAIDAEFASERHRQRIRARTAIVADVSVSVSAASATLANECLNASAGRGYYDCSRQPHLIHVPWQLFGRTNVEEHIPGERIAIES